MGSTRAASDAAPAEGLASREIEQTLRLARDAAEREIARYRVGTFVALSVVAAFVSALMAVVARERTVVPTVYFGACAAYAVVVQRLVRRVGAQDPLIYATLVLDCVAVTALFPLMFHINSVAAPRFAAHLAAPGLALILFVNALRGHRAASLVGAGTASVLVMAVLPPIEGFHPSQVAVALGFWVFGAVGVASARQGRRNLDSFARLHLLRRYLSPAAVERVMREHPDAALALGGRLSTVTLLSADLRGFTAMSERLTPDEVVRQLNAFHGAMLEEIDRHGGLLDKFIGDGILAVFGLDAEGAGVSDDAGARSGVACAHAMLRQGHLAPGVRDGVISPAKPHRDHVFLQCHGYRSLSGTFWRSLCAAWTH
jgi:hypothetical protein